MRDMRKIAKVVRRALASEFKGTRILDVRISEDRDLDGDEILRVDVLFEGVPNDIDTIKFSGFVRSIRPRLLRDADELAFPLFSFIAKDDVGAEKFEAA